MENTTMPTEVEEKNEFALGFLHDDKKPRRDRFEIVTNKVKRDYYEEPEVVEEKPFDFDINELQQQWMKGVEIEEALKRQKEKRLEEEEMEELKKEVAEREIKDLQIEKEKQKKLQSGGAEDDEEAFTFEDI